MSNKTKWICIVSGVYVAAMLVPALAGAAAPKPNFLWWKFDEGAGTVAKDSSGNGRDGVITGATWQTPGAGDLGTCLNFTGSNTTVVNAKAGTDLNGLSAVTIAMWVKSRLTSTDKGFFEVDGVTTGQDNWNIRYDAAGSSYGGTNVLKMGVRATGGGQSLESSNGLQTTEWHHVTLTWKGGVGIKFYSNGVLDKPTGATAAQTGTISGATTMIVGQGCKDSGGGWNGLIDDVRIYNYDLTDAQVADLLSFASPGAASSPTPADKATDVPADASLSWKAAETAQKHSVYLGTDQAAVSNAGVAAPLNVLASLNQAETAYTPAGPLEYGKTYFWRIDEANSTSVVKGDLWSFTVEPYAYPIKTVTATASSSQPDMGPEKTVDGSGMNSLDQHGTVAGTMWLSAGVQPNWIQYEFDKAYKLKELWVWNSNQVIESFMGFGAKSVTIESSLDGNTWTAIDNVPEFAKASGMATYTHSTTVPLGNVLAKFVRLTIKSQWGASPRSGLSEVRFFYVPVEAREPVPATAATGVDLDTILSWRAGREAATHKVYFGMDQQAVTDGTAVAATVTDNRFDPGPLTLGATYYWKVAEVNEAAKPGIWEGPVWSFSTRQYTVVDDFESYTDDEGSRIYQSWIDGYADKSSGSTIGYIDAPFAEKTIVHGGKQSMPFEYNNVHQPYFSEGQRTWNTAQDWTANGADTLTVFFRGNPVSFLEPVPGSITLSGGGADIWNTADEFRFACKPLNGNGTLIAKVESLDETDPWAKAGVMIRETLDAGSRFAAVYATPGNGVRYQARLITGAAATSDTAIATDEQKALKVPVWIKIERTANNFSCFYSSDGVKWTSMTWNPQAVNMFTGAYIGLAVCSHNTNAMATARFSNVSITGSVTGGWQVQAIGPVQRTNEPAALYLTVQDSSGKSKTVVHPDPAATNLSTWQEWRVPLSEFSAGGVKMTAVKKLVIGAGDRSSPKPGGAGLLFIDDIGVGHPQ